MFIIYNLGFGLVCSLFSQQRDVLHAGMGVVVGAGDLLRKDVLIFAFLYLLLLENFPFFIVNKADVVLYTFVPRSH